MVLHHELGESSRQPGRGRRPGDFSLNVLALTRNDQQELGKSAELQRERPVVAGGAPGLREQIIHGETGLIAETPADFPKHVGRLLSDPDLAATLGRNGRRRVSERFLITRYLRDYLQILGELHRS